MIHVLAYLHVRTGTRARFLEAFAKLAPKVRAEPGCLEYGAAVDVHPPLAGQTPVGSDVVVVVEKWASPAALEAHLGAPHMKAWGEEVGGMLVQRVIQVLDPVV